MLIALGLLTAWVGAAPLPDPTTRPATPADVARAVAQLGDGDYLVRQQASSFLWQAGKSAEPALRDALQSADAEVVSRAQAILDKFDYGLYPDTPPQVVETIEEYRSGDANARLRAIHNLGQMGGPTGPAALQALAAIDKRETDPNLRANIEHELAAGAATLAPVLIARGELVPAQALLETAAAAGDGGALRAWSAYLLLRQELPRRIEALRAIAHPSPVHLRQLAYLCRAAGDLPAAIGYAEQAGDPALAHDLRFEACDWKALAAAADPAGSNAEAVGFAVVFQHLAGQEAASAATFDHLCDLLKTADNNDPSALVKALLLHDRHREAIDTLIAHKGYATAFDLLAYQHHFAEALALVDKAIEEQDAQAFELQLKRAQLLYRLGEVERARQLVGQMLDTGAPPGPDDQRAANTQALIKAAAQLGLTDRALAATAAAVEAAPDAQRTDAQDARQALFSGGGFASEQWYIFLRNEFPQDSVAQTLARLRALGSGEPAVLQDLSRRARQSVQGFHDDDLQEDNKWWLQIAETSWRAGEHGPALAMAERLLRVHPTTATAILLAGWYRQDKQFDRGAQTFATSAADPVSLCLAACFQHLAGKTAESTRLLEQASLAALADEEARARMADVLHAYGLPEAAGAQRDLILRLGDVESSQREAIAHFYAARRARDRGEFAHAADLVEHRLGCLRGTTMMRQTEGYLDMTVAVHLAHARADLAAGRADSALVHARAALDANPTDVDVAIELDPLFRRANRADAAEQLFVRARDVCEQTLKTYPHSAQDHNALAWLLARLRRQPDSALDHARQAVALEPKLPGYRDTLAEALFQHGDRAEAIREMQTCIAQDPDSPYFRGQLQRFQAGDPKTDPPDPEADDTAAAGDDDAEP
jgi:tetratricopeptide (TPR) repeat protein